MPRPPVVEVAFDSPPSHVCQVPSMRIYAGNLFAGNVTHVKALILRVRRCGSTQHLIERIRHEQLSTSDTDVSAAVRVDLRRVGFQPGYVSLKLLLELAGFRVLLRIGHDFHLVRAAPTNLYPDSCGEGRESAS
jgi:hypothetical protein